MNQVDEKEIGAVMPRKSGGRSSGKKSGSKSKSSKPLFFRTRKPSPPKKRKK